MVKIGILAIQGAITEHLQAVKECGAEAISVKTVQQLDIIDGLILPGGESTTIGMLLHRFKIDQKIREKAREGMPLYGTCAGAILLAKKITGKHKADHLKIADITIERNAYGSQMDSFTTTIDLLPPINVKNVPAVFIRAPKIVSVGPKVRVLSREGSNIICALDRTVLISTFHPELTKDRTIHTFFITLCKEYAKKRSHHPVDHPAY